MSISSPSRKSVIEPSSGTLSDVLGRLDELVARVADGAAEREAARTLPFEGVELVRQAGIGAVRVPVEHGGPGGTIRDITRVVIEISRADSNLGQALRSHFSFVESLVVGDYSRGPERWFPLVLAGSLFGNATTEVGTANPGEMTTRVRREGGRLLLSGRKFYSTGALFAEWLSVLAVDDSGALVTVAVPVGREGVRMLDDWDGMGQRTTASGGTVFDDVEVDAEDVIASGLHGNRLTHVGAFRQLYLAAVSAGIAKNVLDDTVEYVRRKARPAAHSVAAVATEDPYVLEAVGEIGALAFAAEAVVLRAAECLDEVLDGGGDQERLAAVAVEVAKAQIGANRSAIEAAQRLFDTGGASATSEKLNLHRHWRNARTVASHNPMAYKARAIADFAVNGVRPPSNGYF